MTHLRQQADELRQRATKLGATHIDLFIGDAADDVEYGIAVREMRDMRLHDVCQQCDALYCVTALPRSLCVACRHRFDPNDDDLLFPLDL